MGIAMAARRAERRTRHPHARAGNGTVGDSVLFRHNQIGVGADIAYRGETGLQCGAGVSRHLEGLSDIRLGHQLADGIAAVELAGEMDMGVDQAGQHGGAGQVNDIGALRCGEAGRHRHDTVIMDQDGDLVARGRPCAINKSTGMDGSVGKGRWRKRGKRSRGEKKIAHTQLPFRYLSNQATMRSIESIRFSRLAKPWPSPG